MQVKKRWIAFAAIVTATFPAFGNNSPSIPRDFLKAPDSAVIAGTQGGEGGVMFSNTLQNPRWNRPGMPATRWDGSLPAESPKDNDKDKDQERIASVPEPGSGLLFLIGLGVVLSCGCGRHYGFFQRIRFPGSAVP